jgi:IS5 family transposase
MKNAIRPETWRTVNGLLARYSVRRGLIEGKKVRLDTTAVETNIHYPTDSSLMSDCSRVLCRLIGRARDVDPDAVGPGRLQHRRTKRLADQISRATQRKKQVSQEQLRPTYEKLMQRVERTLSWTSEVSTRLRLSLHAGRFGVLEHAMVQAIVQDLAHFAGLTERVLDQTRRRILNGEVVPSKEKILSIFEPHTELLIRGKAGKRIEYGHMIQIQQVEGNFVTDYGVFARRPAQESDLLASVIASHGRLFGRPPEVLAADKGYFPGMVALRALEKNVELVAIGKKGRRTEEETEREHAVLFRLAQRFRAGIEGTISYLKRAFRLFRCFNKGWQHYVSTIGATIFAHNLVALVRLET